MQRIGTCHFRDVPSARRYYDRAHMGYAVPQKIADGEIAIGPPKLAQGERAEIDRDGRYQIITDRA